MKAIFTFLSLVLIITTAIASAVLYLNENFNLSALLWIIWLVSLTLWINSTASLQFLNNKRQVTQHA